MARFKQIYSIIEDIVNAISWTITVNNPTDNGDGTWSLEMCDTSYLNKCQVFEDSNTDKWEVVDFVFNESLKVKPKGHSNAWTDATINLTIPNYMHGTVRMNAAEYAEIKQLPGVHPIVYLYETLNERPSLVKRDAVERTATARVFIIMENKFKDFLQKDYDVEVYDPLSNIEEKFIEELLNNSNISNFTERYTRINHEQFGYTDRNGYFDGHIFDGELSALELQLPLNINRCSNFKKCK